MPNQNDSIILSQAYSTSAASYGYGNISGIDGTRSHKSQLIFLYRYATLGDGTAVADVTWKNWYDPYIIDETLITLNQAIKTTTVGDTATQTVIDASGTTYPMPAFTLGSGEIYEIQRSQDINNRVVTFGAGSRVTSQGLNNSVDQLFKSLQEIDDRMVSVESGDTQGSSPGGTTLDPGNYGDIIVNIGGSMSVVDDSHNHTIANIDGLQAELDGKVVDIQAGTNVSVSDDGNGTYTINSTGSTGGISDGDKGDVVVSNSGATWSVKDDSHSHVIGNVDGLQSDLDDKLEDAPSDGNQYAREDGAWSVVAPVGADAELTSSLTITDPVGPDQTVNQTYNAGTDLEVIIRDMLVSFQVPDINGLNELPSTIEHGSSITWSSPVTFNSTNTENVNLSSGQILFRRGSTTVKSDTFTFNSGSGTVSQSKAFTTPGGVYEISNASTGTGSDNQSYSIRVSGTDTKSASFDQTESVSVRFRSYFYPSLSNTISGSVSDIATNISALNTNGNWSNVSIANDFATEWAWFALPKNYFSGTPSINVLQSNGFAATFNYIGDLSQSPNGLPVLYSFFRSPSAGGLNPSLTLTVS